MPLTIEQIQELLAVIGPKTPQARAGLAQVGPLRYTETAARCTRRRCGSQTYCRVQGVPLCTTHALKELNEMLVAQGFQGLTTSYKMSPTELPVGRIVSTTTRYKLDVGWSLGKFECIHGINLTKECNGCHNSTVA